MKWQCWKKPVAVEAESEDVAKPVFLKNYLLTIFHVLGISLVALHVRFLSIIRTAFFLSFLFIY